MDQVSGLLPPLGLEEVVEVEGHVFGTGATRRIDLRRKMEKRVRDLNRDDMPPTLVQWDDSPSLVTS